MTKFTLTFLTAISLFAASGDEVDSAMQALRQAMLRSDGAALARLFGERLMYSHSDGRLETRAEAVAAASKGKRSEFTFSNAKTEIYGDVALVRCDVALKSVNQPAGLQMNVLHVWRKSDGRWQLVGRQSTRLGK
ncbi:MAG: nuclear transport factor 2 family protein [Acidobacteria bacterium]|nr:nuclear transport factor 2 family protein [Acidobacteriota bacterium]